MTPIAIFKHDQLGMAVSGRELYGLIVESNATRNIFSDWFRHKERKLGLVENNDYVISSVIIPEISKRAQIEFIVTLDAAKKLAAEATKKRGIGVIAFIREYERTGQVPTLQPEQPQQSLVSASSMPPLTSQYRNGQQSTQQVTPQIDYEKALPDLQVLGSNLSDPQPITQKPEPEENLSPAQQLLKRAQQLVEDENRLKAEQARKVVEQPAESLAQYEARLKSLEGKTNTLLHFFQQAASVLRGLEPVGVSDEVDGLHYPVSPVVCPAVEEAPEPAISPMRAELVQLVNAWAAATEKTEHAVWKYLYGNFSLRSKSRFNPYAHGTTVKDKNYLSVMEKQGHLEELYHLAKSLFTLPPIKA